MSKGKWNSSPPPAVGWWPASRRKVFGSYRWWNGKGWSQPVFKSDPIDLVAFAALEPTGPGQIWWRYWSKGRAMP